MIEIENLTKKYGNHVALDKVSFTVEKGEIIGFLGPNGAGKSTTMNIVSGYISATEGTVKIDGLDILENPKEVKKKIGYLPELPPLYMDMTVDEYLKFVCKIKKVPLSKENETLEEVTNLVRIKDVRNRLIKNLSKGYKQRVGLAQAIIGNPEVLILDEPTVGLDPKQIIDIRNLIKEIGKKHTVILSSHILSEVSAVCDRILIINKGKLVASGTPDELSKSLSYSNKIEIRVKTDEAEASKILSKIEDIKEFVIDGSKEKGTVDILIQAMENKDVREKIFTSFSNTSIPILMMKNVELTLEEIFLQVTEDQKGVTSNVSSII